MLQNIELRRGYPVMAIAFVLVPLGSHIVFGQYYHTLYFIGAAFIAPGIIVGGKA